MVGWKFNKYPNSYLKPQVNFSLYLHHSSVSWEITLLYFFSWNFIWFEQKGAHQSAKFQTFNCPSEISPNLYFDRLLLSKIYKISAKKVQRIYVSWHWRVNAKFEKKMLFQKWQEFGEFWSEHSKVSKIFTLIGLFCGKYITFDLKKYRAVIIHDTKKSCKIWRKTVLWFGKWHEKFGRFLPEHLQVSKLGLWWDPFDKVEEFTQEL